MILFRALGETLGAGVPQERSSHMTKTGGRGATSWERACIQSRLRCRPRLLPATRLLMQQKCDARVQQHLYSNLPKKESLATVSSSNALTLLHRKKLESPLVWCLQLLQKRILRPALWSLLKCVDARSMKITIAMYVYAEALSC